MTNYRRRPHRLGGLLAVAALLALLLAACGGDGGDSATATSTSSAGAATPTAAAAEPTATSTQQTDEATPTMAAPEPTATNPTAPQPTATTATPAEPTATTGGGDDATPTTAPGGEDDPFEDLQTLDPEQLPNFSLSSTVRIENTDETGEDAVLTIEIVQSSVDHYHMVINSGADADTMDLIEVWQVGERVFMREAGTITELPPGTPSFFSPELFLQQITNINEEVPVDRIGEENVAGRETTHYRASPEDFLAATAQDSEYLQGASNAQGKADVWIDNELFIMIRARIDITWTNSDGSTGLIFQEYDIYDIGSTPEVQAPQ